MALSKPARLLISPDRYDPNRPNLMRLLHDAIARGTGSVREHGWTYLANAHRLDFETTGVLLLAKNKPALVNLANQFGAESVSKTYVALVHGAPKEDRFSSAKSIAAHPFKTGLMRVDMKLGKKSHTDFEVMERFKGFTLMRCLPKTGRTHQIRVHLEDLGHPIVADGVYGGQPLYLSNLKSSYRLKGKRTERALTPRLALHAERLSVKQPSTGMTVEIADPIPKDLMVAIKYLRRYAVLWR